MPEVTEMPSKILIDHLLTGGSPCITQWMAKNAQRWSIPQRKEIQEEITQGLREEKLTDVQKHYLVELRMALVKVEAIEAAQYA